ncbi:hypothetical protein SLE2022_038420 [Rubroshorea leprosula]
MDKQGMTQIDVVDLESDGLRFRPTSGNGNTTNDAISVEQYGDDRELELAIEASLLASQNEERDLELAISASVLSHNEERELELAFRASLLTTENFTDLDGSDEDSTVLDLEPEITPRNRRKPLINFSLTGPGESSNSKSVAVPAPAPPPPFVCEICVEPKSQNESFKIKGCSHSYCTDCMTKFVASKLQDNITGIGCPVPNCSGLLEPEYCRQILPPEVFNRWGDALCEGMIIGSQRFYCPFKDCSALLIDDGAQRVKESECPNCFRLFCAQCKVPWHTSIECVEFQKLHKDEREHEDIMLLNLAQSQKWMRCPKCRIVVEKTYGCNYLKCRCGYSFCYNCGGPSCPTTHMCPRCRHV